MPKPVLSDSLFNADDVATAILSEANLQIANSNLGVTDISSVLSVNSNYNTDTNRPNKLFYFNGFVFIQLFCYKTSTPSDGEEFAEITDSNYYPSYGVVSTYASRDNESSIQIKISTAGKLTIDEPVAAGDSTHRIYMNNWYRT